MAVTELIIALAVLQYLYFGIEVGRARGLCKVPAPATSGHPVFERHFRVQMNTLELLVVFLPLLWLCSVHVSQLWIGLIGAVYLAGRVLYRISYVADPGRRTLGFVLSMLPVMALSIMLLFAALRSLIHI